MTFLGKKWSEKAKQKVRDGIPNRIATSEKYRKTLLTKECVMDKNPSWTGGRYSDAKGYIRVWVAPNKYDMEHRIIMEKHLGRKLSKDEVIHHKNGIKFDNKIENLEVMTKSQHVNLHNPHKMVHFTCPQCGYHQ